MEGLPLLTAALPGTGGRLKAHDDDFVVEELPAYPRSGEGSHVFIFIEKRDLTTAEAVRRIAAALRCKPADIGQAGQKDRHAVTRQWLSLPPPCTPEAARALTIDGLVVLEATRHGNKLRTGHLAGNRFVLTVRDCVGADPAARAQAVLAELARPPGVPNFYGEQRFGVSGDNAARGKAILLGGRGPRDGRERRFLVSALQSALFNQVLAARLAAGTFRTVLAGDVLAKVQSGGLFVCEEPLTDQPRLDAGEVAPTGPMFGKKMKDPGVGSATLAAELAALAALGLEPAVFARARDTDGTRRPLGVGFLEAPRAIAHPVDPAAIQVTFALPPGSYATVVAGEIMKSSGEASASPASQCERTSCS
jgi:tRNA pseudouridine13 synthase